MEKYYKNVSWSSYDLPKVFKDRGVDDPEKLPGFYYRDDALRLWDAIKDYIRRILSIYYHSDEDIEKVECSFVVAVSSRFSRQVDYSFLDARFFKKKIAAKMSK